MQHHDSSTTDTTDATAGMTAESWRPRRLLWEGGPMTSSLGLGTWALGGPSSAGDQPLGWGSGWDAGEARAVVRAAMEAGITLFDTADAYGAGTAERILGDALTELLGPLTGARRDEVVLVSKWGNTIDERTRQLTGQDASPGYVRTALEQTLRRLRTDHLDVYLLHLSGLPAEQAAALLEALRDLVTAGMVRGYGWSTDDPDLARSWLGEPGLRAFEMEVNVVHDAPALIEMCETNRLAALVRGPFGHGLLSGGHPRGSRITDPEDFRRHAPDWLAYFHDGYPDERLSRQAEAVREVLCSDGRTPAQGALAWLWARSPVLLPVPGARGVAQVCENAAALHQGPLTAHQMAQVDSLLGTVDPRADSWLPVEPELPHEA